MLPGILLLPFILVLAMFSRKGRSSGRLAVFGDFDLFELEDQDPVFIPDQAGVLEPEDPSPGEDYVAVHVLFYGTGLGITILLMNLLIGVLGQNYELYHDRVQQLFTQTRAKMLLEIDRRPSSQLYRFFMRQVNNASVTYTARSFGSYKRRFGLDWVQCDGTHLLLLPMRPLVGQVGPLDCMSTV